MVRQSLDAFVNLDSQLARRVVRMDDEVDRYNDEIIDELTAQMKPSPDSSSRACRCSRRRATWSGSPTTRRTSPRT